MSGGLKRRKNSWQNISPPTYYVGRPNQYDNDDDNDDNE